MSASEQLLKSLRKDEDLADVAEAHDAEPGESHVFDYPECDIPKDQLADALVYLNCARHAYWSGPEQSLATALEACESPIERSLLGALVVRALKSNGPGVLLSVCGDRSFSFGDSGYPWRLMIDVQAKVGRFRVDFVVCYTSDEPTDRGSRQLAVECDGHGFHERTKQQAKRDRARDCELQRLGFKVFRFTGSEIWSDPVSCATEIVEEATKPFWSAKG